MREIKFRAWDRQRFKMVIVMNLTRIEQTPFMMTRDTIDAKTLAVKSEDLELMQYTGLKDKNGKEIYEGDIIDHIATTGVVIFEDGMFALDSNANTQFGKYKQPLCYMSVLECEVIGNIYENAELLK